MNGYAPKDIKVPGLAAVSGIVSALPVSADFGLSAGGSLHLRVDLDVTGVTVVGAISAKLQHRTPSGSFADLAGANASVSITGDGTFGLTQLAERAADQANLPLRSQLRVVLTTTNAGDAITVSKIWLCQEL
jgi:hypothetical protein